MIDKFLDWLIRISIILLIYTIIMTVLPYTNYRTYTSKKSENSIVIHFEQMELEEKKIRKLLEKETGVRFYVLKEKAKNVEQAGNTSIVFRYIRLYRTNLSSFDYAQTLCHEMCHIKFCTGNETYTQFMTFKILYESDNEFLHNCGLEFANAQFSGGWNYVANYTCTYYIERYFKERNLIQKGDNGLWMLKNA